VAITVITRCLLSSPSALLCVYVSLALLSLCVVTLRRPIPDGSIYLAVNPKEREVFYGIFKVFKLKSVLLIVFTLFLFDFKTIVH